LASLLVLSMAPDDNHINLMSTSLSISDEMRRQPPLLSLLKRIGWFIFHVCVFYLVLRFSRDILAVWLSGMSFRQFFYPDATAAALRLFFSHLVTFSVFPALVAGVHINAKMMHRVARFVWIVPVVIFGLIFLFGGHGIYPTMLWESDFGIAFHHFFGNITFDGPEQGRLPFASWKALDQAYSQMIATSPVYAGIGYSVGATIGMSSWCHGLQRILGKTLKS